MTLHELKNVLATNDTRRFALQLPDGRAIPASLHITEVGLVSKTFIDCGGKVHSEERCHLQAWLGEDVDHRLLTGKLADILQMAQKIVPDDSVDVEVEYEDVMISQYRVAGFLVSDDAITFRLEGKHTDCLAKELCLVPSLTGESCCGPSGCC